jgi:hypothetical protein
MQRLARPLAHQADAPRASKRVTASDSVQWPASLRAGGGARRPPGASPEPFADDFAAW